MVRSKIDRLVGSINKEISNDRSLAEFHSKQPVPWQLREIMAQRAEAWVQRVYDICCDAYKDSGKALSADFDRAVWAYCIDPFILGERLSGGRDYTVSVLLELLLCAVGSPPEKRRLLRVSQNDCCLAVRHQVFETWYDRLHHLPPRINEALALMVRAREMEVRAARMARGLLPEPPLAPPTPPMAESPSSGQPQSAPVTLSAMVPTSPAAYPVQENTETEPQGITEGDTPTQSSGSQAATWNTIEISFLSDERVQIRNGTKSETCNYAELGFADGRNGKPNRAWITLRALAEQRGIVRTPTKPGQSWSDVEKRMQEIRKLLREHFCVSTYPIPFIEGGGYQARFKIGCSPSFRT